MRDTIWIFIQQTSSSGALAPATVERQNRSERITFRDPGIDSVAFLHDEEHQNFTSAVYRVVDLLPNARQRDLLANGRIVKMDRAEAVPSRAPGLADSRLRWCAGAACMTAEPAVRISENRLRSQVRIVVE